jgi:succinyl-CoA synthetase beta subunit
MCPFQASQGPMVIACAQGGTSIEDLAEEDPDQIIKVPIDPIVGITDENAAAVVAGLQTTGPVDDAKEQIKALYNLFVEADCTMVEVNPLAEDDTGKLIAADAKIGFDDNAGFRQKEIFSMRDESQEDPREVAAAKWDLNVRCHSLFLPDSVRGLADACACVPGGRAQYIGLDGSIGCMVNGAGLAMATMDIVQMHGGTPANFLDVGGAASEENVRHDRCIPLSGLGGWLHMPWVLCRVRWAHAWIREHHRGRGGHDSCCPRKSICV